jgi:hypothetical protein
VKQAQRVARVEIAHVAVASPTAVPPAASSATIAVGPQVGDKVWLYSRENGRLTENLATVTAVRDAKLDVTLNDQGTVIEYRGVKPWNADSIVGYARVK